MLKLTHIDCDGDSKDVWVTSHLITSMEVIQYQAGRRATQLHMGGNRYLSVKESPAEILLRSAKFEQ